MTLSMRARPRAGQTPWLGPLLIGSHLAVGGVEQPLQDLPHPVSPKRNAVVP
jgi:hypothetical protein